MTDEHAGTPTRPGRNGTARGPRLPYRELDAAQMAIVLARNGQPLNLFRILAHHRRLLDRVTRLGGAFSRAASRPTTGS